MPTRTATWQLVTCSADSPADLDRARTALADRLAHHADEPQARTADLPYRDAIVAADRADALRRLRADRPAARPARSGRPVVFMFPGVGDHYVGMGLELYRSEPVFRSELDRCAELFADRLGADPRTVLYPDGIDVRAAADHTKPDLAALLRRRDQDTVAPIDRTSHAQPLVFAVEYALAQMLRDWGIEPAAMVGYSVGEYVAACVAGVLSLPDAVTLVARRAELIETAPPGAMLVALLPEHELRAVLPAELSVAAVNGPELCVAAGPENAVARLEQRLTADGVANLRTTSRHAFHSTMMAPLAEPLARLLDTCDLRPPAMPFLSNVTGTWITDRDATSPDYWARHLRHTVRWHDCLTELWRLPDAIAVEVGAGTMLGSLAAQHPDCPRDTDPPVFATLPGASAEQSDLAALLSTAGGLWCLGVPLDRRDDPWTSS